MQWPQTVPLEIERTSSEVRLYIRPRPLAHLICAKIDDLKDLLKRDPEARATWYEKAHRHKREIRLECYRNRCLEKVGLGRFSPFKSTCCKVP
jgi:hypothetical protein